MRRALVLLTLGMVSLCMGATEETNDDDSTTSFEECVAKCKASDHPGCEQTCNSTETITWDCAVRRVGR